MSIHRALLLAKGKALAAHIAISAVLVAVALALLFWRWLPAPLFATEGGGEGLKLILLVDVVLGPLLTLVVFNPAKPRAELVRDLGVVALIQLAGYGYGLHSLHAARVQALAYENGRFHSVRAPVFSGQQIAADGWQSLGAASPYVVDVRSPQGDEVAGVMTFQLAAGIPAHALHFLYQPYAHAAARHWPEGRTLAQLQASQPAVAAAAQAWLHRQSLAENAVRFYRVEGVFGNAVLAFDETGRWRGGFAGELPPFTPSSG